MTNARTPHGWAGVAQIAVPELAPQAVRERIRKRWEQRRAETEIPPRLLGLSGEVEEWGGDVRYLSADYRSFWPRPDDSPAPGFVPLSLRVLEVRP